jgi:hypothetical protein
VGGHQATGALLVVAEELVDFRAILYRRENLLLPGGIQVAQDIRRVIVVQLLDDLGREVGIQRRERLTRMRLLRHLRQSLAGELRRERLHRRDSLLLIERGEHLSQVGRLELVGSAGEQAELTPPDEIHHPVEQLLHEEAGTSGTAGVGPERISNRSMRVGDA